MYLRDPIEVLKAILNVNCVFIKGMNNNGPPGDQRITVLNNFEQLVIDPMGRIIFYKSLVLQALSNIINKL